MMMGKRGKGVGEKGMAGGRWVEACNLHMFIT